MVVSNFHSLFSSCNDEVNVRLTYSEW